MKSLNILTAIPLIKFTISKLAAYPEPVEGFIEMAKPLEIDPAFFRISSRAMVGALISEFFLRSQVAIPLVILALLITVINFLTQRKTITKLLPSHNFKILKFKY